MAAGITTKLDAQVGITSSADKFFGFFKNNMHNLAQMFPQNIKSFQVLGGGPIKTGSVTYWKYNVTGTPETAQIIVQSLDEENKSINFVVLGGDILDLYNSFKVKLHVVPSGQGGSLVKWNVEFEKEDANDPNPEQHVNFVVRMSKGLDTYLTRA